MDTISIPRQTLIEIHRILEEAAETVDQLSALAGDCEQAAEYLDEVLSIPRI